MSGLHLHAVRDANEAAAWLVRELRTMDLGPFDRPVVLAEHAALQRHLLLAIARAEGCVANVRMVKPAGWLHDAVNLDGVQREWSVPSMTWALTNAIRESMDVLPAPARGVLESGDAIVLLDLAGSVARRFRAYLLYRPDLLLHWERSDVFITSDPDNERWQRALWRALVERAERPSPTSLIQAARAGNLTVGLHAPATLLMVGDPAIPPALRELLTAVAATRDVRWCVLQPHGDAAVPRLSERRQCARDDLRARGLARIAMATTPESLLGAVQHQLRGAEPTQRDALDNTLTLHRCHSALREIETLREQAIKALEDNRTLRPHDITLYVTSLPEYLPAIDAVFGVEEAGIPRMPYSVAGKPFRENSTVILALTQLLAVADGRVTLDDVGALLGLSPIAGKAELTDDDVATALGLLTQAGVTWGRDAEERHARFAIPALDAGTWRHGIDRLVLGVATGRAEVPVNGLLPTSGHTASGADLIGRLAAWTDALFAQCAALRIERNSTEWQVLIEETLRNFIAVQGPDDARAARTLREALARLLSNIERAAPGTRLSLGTIRAILEQEFEEGTGSTGHLRGGVRICRLEPGVVLPSKIVLIAGVSDALHPGGGGSIAWDLLTKHPKPEGDGSNATRARAEDPDARADAFDTFREAVCSAGQRLHLSWTGVTLQKQEKRAASVAVAELRDLIAGIVPTQAEQIIIEEPPHPFSLKLFTPGEQGARQWRSAAKGWEQAAKLMHAGALRPRFAHEPLAADPSRIIALDALASAVEDPTKHFCERVVGLLMRTDDDDLAQSEPQAIKALKAQGGVDSYFREVGWRLERAQIRGDGRTADEIATWLLHQPELPYGEEGRVVAAQVAREWFPRLDAMRKYPWQEARSIEVRVGEYMITGRLDRLTPEHRVVAGLYDVEPYSAVKHWVTHLVMNLLAIRGETVPRVTLVDAQSAWYFTPVADAEVLLADLCELYTEASQGPVPLFRKAGIRWLDARKRVASSTRIDAELESKALAAAQSAWQGTRGHGGVKFAGEGQHEHHRLCWPMHRLTEDRAIFSAFTAAADRVLLPMLRHEAKEAPQ